MVARRGGRCRRAEEVESYSVTRGGRQCDPRRGASQKACPLRFGDPQRPGREAETAGEQLELGTVNPPDSAHEGIAWYSGRYGS